MNARICISFSITDVVIIFCHQIKDPNSFGSFCAYVFFVFFFVVFSFVHLQGYARRPRDGAVCARLLPNTGLQMRERRFIGPA